MCWTSSRRSVSLHPGSNGGRPRLLKVTKSECPDVWIRLPLHKHPVVHVRKDNLRRFFGDMDDFLFIGNKDRNGLKKAECCSHLEEIDETCKS